MSARMRSRGIRLVQAAVSKEPAKVCCRHTQESRELRWGRQPGRARLLLALEVSGCSPEAWNTTDPRSGAGGKGSPLLPRSETHHPSVTGSFRAGWRRAVSAAQTVPGLRQRLRMCGQDAQGQSASGTRADSGPSILSLGTLSGQPHGNRNC